MGQRRASTALTHWFRWRHVTCKVIEKPHPYLAETVDLDLHVIAACDTPAPLGLRIQLRATTHEISAAGSPVAFMTDRFNREARSKDSLKAEFLWRQEDLFERLAAEEE